MVVSNATHGRIVVSGLVGVVGRWRFGFVSDACGDSSHPVGVTMFTGGGRHGSIIVQRLIARDGFLARVSCMRVCGGGDSLD